MATNMALVDKLYSPQDFLPYLYFSLVKRFASPL
jgi:hypothetical protein